MPYVVTNKIAFVAEASKILSSSLDYSVTLGIIAKLIVTNVADFCIIDIFDGRKLKRLAVDVSDPAKQNLAQRMFEFVPNPKNKDAIYDTAKHGKPTIIKKATREWLEKVTTFQVERETIEALGLNSHVFVPLKSRGQIIGVLTLASMDKDFFYTEEDAIFIEEIADRAGTSVDKARLYSEAQEALKTRDEFLLIASHELKTPLTSILLNLQGILKKISNTQTHTKEIKEVIKMLETSKQQSFRMSRLINDLLNVSVASTGRLKVEKERFDMNQLIEESIAQYLPQLKSHNIKIDYISEGKLIGRWDRIRMEQVIVNFISNAIKYGRGNPIKISLVEKNKQAIITIEDQGIGIADGDKEMIFDQFKRAVSPKEYKGLGVGLYICRQIVDAHKGTIDLVSEPDRGSKFIITLPL